MDVEYVVAPVVPAELADRLEEWQALDIANGAADFDDRQVETFGGLADALFYFVGDVRDDLDGRAEIIAAALLLDHGVVDLPGGAVVAPAHPGFEKALVVAEIEIGFRAVVGHENLAMLQRAHRAGIDVDIRIHLEQRHPQPARLEQRAERSRRQALAQRRNHAAAHENELGLVVAIHFLGPPRLQPPSRRACSRARVRSSAVSTSSEGATEATTRIRKPRSSARSCSSFSSAFEHARLKLGKRSRKSRR